MLGASLSPQANMTVATITITRLVRIISAPLLSLSGMSIRDNEEQDNQKEIPAF